MAKPNAPVFVFLEVAAMSYETGDKDSMFSRILLSCPRAARLDEKAECPQARSGASKHSGLDMVLLYSYLQE